MHWRMGGRAPQVYCYRGSAGLLGCSCLIGHVSGSHQRVSCGAVGQRPVAAIVSAQYWQRTELCAVVTSYKSVTCLNKLIKPMVVLLAHDAPVILDSRGLASVENAPRSSFFCINGFLEGRSIDLIRAYTRCCTRTLQIDSAVHLLASNAPALRHTRRRSNMASTRTASMHQPAKWERAAEPVASSLALLTPKGLGRLACTCRTWRDAAARVGTLVHIYSISSHCSDLDGDDGEHYGVSYLGREPPPFDSCRGPSGGILELSLLGRDDALDDGAREWPEDVDSDVEEHRNYSAVTVTLASPALVECICTCIEAVNAANITFHNSDIRNRTLAFDLHGDVRFVPNRLARLPRACSIVPMPILRQIAQKIVQTDPSGIGADWAARLLGNDPPWPLSLSDVKDRLRITRFHFDAPRGTRPRVDWTFFRAVLLPTKPSRTHVPGRART